MTRTVVATILIFFTPVTTFAHDTGHFSISEHERTDHTPGETARHLAFLYGISWGLYYVTQPVTFRTNGSWTNYRSNFGKMTLIDHDPPWFNWIIHPYSGSQIFLYYRAHGYTKGAAFELAALQSLLFEFTAEIYTERASLEDIVNTPLLGSVLGRGLELGSLWLLEQDHWAAHVLGHLLNPMTLFRVHEGRTALIASPARGTGLSVAWSF